MLEDTTFTANKRLEIYEFLSYAFLNIPSEELLNLIKKKSKYFEKLTGNNISFMDDKTLEEFEQEYYDRFFVPTSSLFIPPYETSIRNRKSGKGKRTYGPVDGKETFHVKACYELVDFKINDLKAFKPLKDSHHADHIAFELAFISYLINFQVKALENKDEDRANKWEKLQRDFLKDHISKWINDYAGLVKEKGEGLYSYLIDIATSWIDLDFKELNKKIK